MTRRLSLALPLLLTLIAESAAGVDLFITEPAVGAPAFGEVGFSARVYPEGSTVRVEFFVDGAPVGTLEAPPYRLRIDLGEENLEHRFVVRARDSSGEIVESVLVTPAIQIDERVDAALQQLYVTIEAEGRRILDLRQTDFELADDNQEQEIVTFGRGDVPLACVTLIDASSSMRGRQLRFALRAAAELASRIEPEDEISIQLFSDRLLHESACRFGD